MDANPPAKAQGFSGFLRSHLSTVIVGAVILLAIILQVSGVLGGWGMPGAAQIAFVILVIAAALWITETVPLFVTSLIILALSLVWLRPGLAVDGVVPSKEIFTSPFFSDVILLFLGGFVLAAGLHKYHLDEQMARWMLRRTRGDLPRLIAGVMAVTAFLSMWLSNTATAAMMLALIIPISQQLPEGSSKRKALLLAVPFAANVGGLGTPIGSPPNAIALQYMRQIGEAPSFAMWMAIGIPGVLGILTGIWFLLVYGYGVKGRVEIGTPHEEGDISFVPSKERKVVLGCAILTALGWLTSSWHGLSSGTVALLPLIVFFGAGLLRIADLRALSWDVLLLMGGGLCLGVVLSQSGLADWVLGLMDVKELGMWGLIAVFAIVGCSVSTVMSNTATANLLMPIVLGLGMAEGSAILVGVAFACSLAMALPISTPPNAMAFSSGELKVKDVLKPGLMISAGGLILMLTIGYWWWGVVGFR